MSCFPFTHTAAALIDWILSIKASFLYSDPNALREKVPACMTAARLYQS